MISAVPKISKRYTRYRYDNERPSNIVPLLKLHVYRIQRVSLDSTSFVIYTEIKTYRGKSVSLKTLPFIKGFITKLGESKETHCTSILRMSSRKKKKTKGDSKGNLFCISSNSNSNNERIEIKGTVKAIARYTSMRKNTQLGT